MGEPAVDPTPRAAASYPATSYPATSSPGERAVPAAREVRGTPAPREVRGAAVLLRRVTKQYPGQSRAAVGGLTLEVPAGDVVTLVGPPGCGKTTVLRMVNRLLDPSSGSVLLDGEDVAGMDERALRRGIGFMLRTGGLFPHMTVAANTALVPRMLGWPRRRTAARVAEVLELVGLDPATDGRRHPAELSPASTSGRAWPVPWPRSRASCCWTTRSVRWTPPPGTPCSVTCWGSSGGWGSRSCARPGT